jgi:hypothetical protein
MESEVCDKKITRAINHSVTNYLAQSNVQIFCNYTRSIGYHFADVFYQFLISFLGVGQDGNL